MPRIKDPFNHWLCLSIQSKSCAKIRSLMPPKLRDAIQSLMTGLENDAAGKSALNAAKATGMGKAEDRDYNPHRKMTAAVFGQDKIAR